MDLNRLYTVSDFYNRCSEEKIVNTIFLSKLTDKGEFIKLNGKKIDITKSSMERVIYIFETNYQKIILQENTFFDDSERSFVVNFNIQIENLVSLNKDLISRLNHHLKIQKIIIFCLSILFIFFSILLFL